MNILFLMKNFELGGIEIVSLELAKYFIKKGHKCIFFSLELPHPMIMERIPNSVRLYIQKDKRISKENVQSLRKALLENNVDVIINQWGLPFFPTKIAQLARKGLSIRYISVYHNSPDTNARIQEILIKLSQNNSKLRHKYLSVKLNIVRLLSRYSMKYVFNQSDAYVVLSHSFVDKFRSFCKLHTTSKVYAIGNPLTLPEECCIYSKTLKRNEIIYVGRMDYNQKRIFRVIEVWKLLVVKYPDWSLRFVGDGPERKSIEHIVQEEKISNVYFEGFCSPMEYYRKASLLIQTSEYEGFPLVLVEAMSFGVIPIVYGSYSAVYDVINYGDNGLVLAPEKGGFNAVSMSILFDNLMQNSFLRYKMAIRASKIKDKFSLNRIYNCWLPILSGE